MAPARFVKGFQPEFELPLVPKLCLGTVRLLKLGFGSYTFGFSHFNSTAFASWLANRAATNR